MRPLEPTVLRAMYLDPVAKESSRVGAARQAGMHWKEAPVFEHAKLDRADPPELRGVGWSPAWDAPPEP